MKSLLRDSSITAAVDTVLSLRLGQTARATERRMNYEEEAKDLLGEDAYNKFLDAVDEGKVSLQEMTDIAFGLHKVVGGKFKRAKAMRHHQTLKH